MALALLVSGLADQPGAAPLAAGLVGAVTIALRPRAWGLLLLGIALSILAAQLGGGARNLLDASDALGDRWPAYDLTKTPFPVGAPEYVEVSGHFRDEWVLDEYAVPQGEHPDQNQPARAVLVPMAGSTDEVLKLEGAIVVARVSPGRADADGRQTVRGKVAPLDPQVIGALVRVGAGVTEDDLEGVLVDTFDVPDRSAGWTRAGLALLCSLIALGCFWFAGAAPRE